MSIKVTVNLDGLNKLRKQIETDIAMMQAIAKAWSTIYRSFVRQRFVKQSRGGGEWPALKPATIKRRRGRGVGAAILRDTGLLLASFQPEGNGGLMKTSPLRSIGFQAELSGGGATKTGVRLSDVASYHHHGDGRLPKRELLVEPDAATIKNMGDHAKRIVVKHLNQ